MSKSHRVGVLLVSGLLLTVHFGLAQGKIKLPKQGRPPQPLAQQSDGHWSANRSLPPAEGYEVHTVKSGDTLWDITKQYLRDPFLWPQMWELNSQIKNPHWIYPGDQVVLKRMVVVVPPTVAPPTEAPADKSEPAPEAATVAVVPTPAASAEPTPVLPVTQAAPVPPPVASFSDLYCAGFFFGQEIKPKMVIVGGEESENKTYFSDRDIVYTNQGSAQGVKPGDEFQAIRRIDGYSHYGSVYAKAASKDKYGVGYRDIGRLRVLLAHENSSTAEVVFSCEELHVGDILMAGEQRISPLKRPPQTFDKFAPSSDKTKGTIFFAKEFRVFAGTGHIVYVDIGQQQSVQVGDYFRVVRFFKPSNISAFNRADFRKYRDTYDSVRKVIGELVILRVEAKSATALVTHSVQDILLGDMVEQE